jgi:dihydroneopterin aldolase
MDRIRVKQLRVTAFIGVPEEERRRAQALEVDLELCPVHPWNGLEDDLAGTVDYFAVSEMVRDLASARPRRLIETLAQEIAEGVLKTYPVREVEVTVRKFVLSDAGSVEVVLRRKQGTGTATV